MSYDNWKGRSDRDDSPEPDEWEIPERCAELVDEIDRMEREISAYREALEECLEWLKPRYDGEYFPDSPAPRGNSEMQLGLMIEEVLGKTFK